MKNPTPSVAVKVATAVAGRVGVEETELPPISEVVDPDALDRLFARPDGEPASPPDRVEFEYCGYWVVVAGDRTVSVEPSPGPAGATEGDAT